VQPNLKEVQKARQLLSQHLPVTRLVPAPCLSQLSGARVHLKLETDLFTGSFKVRGALYSLSVNSSRQPIKEVVASSTGNHGAAVAYAAKLLGIKATIFLPAGCNPVKRVRIAGLGAEIVEKGADGADAFEFAAKHAATDPEIFLLNDATDPDLPCGPGLVGFEILEQYPKIQSIFVPVGDTALIRGVAGVVKQISPEVRIVGVQSDQAPSYYLSWKKGEVVTTESCNTIADGLATRIPDRANVEEIRQVVDDVMLVSEKELLRAIELLLLEEHVLAEPAGAASTAALLKSNCEPDEEVALVVSGANISRDVLRSALGVSR
jgi:threonine dehydratase